MRRRDRQIRLTDPAWPNQAHPVPSSALFVSLFAGFWKEEAGYGVRTSWLGDAGPVTERTVVGELVEPKAQPFRGPVRPMGNQNPDPKG